MVDKKATPEGLQTYVSPVIEDGLKFEEAIALLLSFYPENFGWIKLPNSVDLKADYVITYTGETPDDVTKFGNFVADTWTNGPTEYTNSPISFSVVGTIQNNTPVAYMYVRDGAFVYGRTCDSATSEWKRIDIEDTSTGLPSFMFQRGDDAPPNENAIWIKPSYDADGTITAIDALCHLPDATDWTSVYYPGKMDESIYDTTGKHSSPFEYVGTSLNKITNGYGDFLLHKQNALALIHITANDRGNWDAALSVVDLDKLVESAKTDMTTLIADEYEKNTHVNETNTNLTTSYDAQVAHIADNTMHITTEEKNTWATKASSTHVHKGPTDGRVTIAGEKVVSGTIPMDQLPDDIKERVYEISSLDVLADPITDVERHTKYHNGNILRVPTTSDTDIDRWYRITDSSRIGTPLYLGAVLEFTNTGSLFDNWDQVRNHPTTLEGYGIDVSSREDHPQVKSIGDFSDDPNARITIRKILYDENRERFLLLANHEDLAKFTHEIVLYSSPTGEVWERLPIRFSTIGLTPDARTRVYTISVTGDSTYLLCGQQKTTDGYGPLILKSTDLTNWTKDTVITNTLLGTTNAAVVASDTSRLIVVSDGGIWTVAYNIDGESTHSPYMTFAANVKCNDVMGPYDYAAPMFVAKTIYDAAYSRDTLCYFGKTNQLTTIDLATKLGITIGDGGELVIDSVFGGATTLVIVFRVKLDSAKTFQKKIAQTHDITSPTYSQIDLDESLEPFAFVDNYVFCRKTTPTGLQIIKKPMDVIGAGTWEVDSSFDGLDIEDIFYEAKIQVSFYVKDRNKIETLAVRRSPNAFVRVSPSFSDLSDNTVIDDFGSLIYDEEKKQYVCIAYTGGLFGIYASETGEVWTVLTPTSRFTNGEDLAFKMKGILAKTDTEWVLYLKDTTASPDPANYTNQSGIWTSSDLTEPSWTKLGDLPTLGSTDEFVKLLYATNTSIFLISTKPNGGETHIYKADRAADIWSWSIVLDHTFTDKSIPVKFEIKGTTCVLFHLNDKDTTASYPNVMYSNDNGSTWKNCPKEAFPVLSEGSLWHSLGGALSGDGLTCYLFVEINQDGWYIGKADTSSDSWVFTTKMHSIGDIGLAGTVSDVLYMDVDPLTSDLRYAIDTTAWYSRHLCVITEKNLEFTTIEHLDYDSGDIRELYLKQMCKGTDGICILAKHDNVQPGDNLNYPIAYTSHPVDLNLSSKLYTKEEIDAFFSQMTQYGEARAIYDKLYSDESLSLGDADYVGIQERVGGATDGVFPMDDDALATIHTHKLGFEWAPQVPVTPDFSSLSNVKIYDTRYLNGKWFICGTYDESTPSKIRPFIASSSNGSNWKLCSLSLWTNDTSSMIVIRSVEYAELDTGSAYFAIGYTDEPSIVDDATERTVLITLTSRDGYLWTYVEGVTTHSIISEDGGPYEALFVKLRAYDNRLFASGWTVLTKANGLPRAYVIYTEDGYNWTPLPVWSNIGKLITSGFSLVPDQSQSVDVGYLNGTLYVAVNAYVGNQNQTRYTCWWGKILKSQDLKTWSTSWESQYLNPDYSSTYFVGLAIDKKYNIACGIYNAYHDDRNTDHRFGIVSVVGSATSRGFSNLTATAVDVIDDKVCVLAFDRPSITLRLLMISPTYYFPTTKYSVPRSPKSLPVLEDALQNTTSMAVGDRDIVIGCSITDSNEAILSQVGSYGEIISTTKISQIDEYAGNYMRRYDISNAPGNDVLDDMIYTGKEYLAVGTSETEGGTSNTLWITKSLDGKTWTDLPITGPVASLSVMTIIGIVSGAFGFYIYGMKDMNSPVVLISTDGETWIENSPDITIIPDTASYYVMAATTFNDSFYLYGRTTSKTDPSIEKLCTVYLPSMNGAWTAVVGELDTALATAGTVVMTLNGVETDGKTLVAYGTWVLNPGEETESQSALILIANELAPTTWTVRLKSADDLTILGHSDVQRISTIKSIEQFCLWDSHQSNLYFYFLATITTTLGESSAVCEVDKTFFESSTPGISVAIDKRVYPTLSVYLPGNPTICGLCWDRENILLPCYVTMGGKIHYTICYIQLSPDQSIFEQVWSVLTPTYDGIDRDRNDLITTITANGLYMMLCGNRSYGETPAHEKFVLQAQIEPALVPIWKSSSLVASSDSTHSINPSTITITRIRFLNNQFFGIGYLSSKGSFILLQSSDGKQWTYRVNRIYNQDLPTQLPLFVRFYDIAYCSGIGYIVCGCAGQDATFTNTAAIVAISVDEMKWEMPGLSYPGSGTDAMYSAMYPVDNSSVLLIGWGTSGDNKTPLIHTMDDQSNLTNITINMPFGQLQSLAVSIDGSTTYLVGCQKATADGVMRPLILKNTGTTPSAGYTEVASDVITAYIGSDTTSNYELVDIAMSDTGIIAIGNKTGTDVTSTSFLLAKDGTKEWICTTITGEVGNLLLNKITYSNEFIMSGMVSDLMQLRLYRVNSWVNGIPTVDEDKSIRMLNPTSAPNVGAIYSDGSITFVAFQGQADSLYQSTTMPIPTIKMDLEASEDLSGIPVHVGYLNGIYVLVSEYLINDGSTKRYTIYASTNGTDWKDTKTDLLDFVKKPYESIGSFRLQNCCVVDNTMFLVGSYQGTYWGTSGIHPFVIASDRDRIGYDWRIVSIPTHLVENISRPYLHDVTSICGGNGLYVMGGESSDSNTTVLVSENLFEWSGVPIVGVPAATITDMTHHYDGLTHNFVAVGNVQSSTEVSILVSSDGSTWTKVDFTTSGIPSISQCEFYLVRFFRGIWMITGQYVDNKNWKGLLLTSADTLNWSLSHEFDSFRNIKNLEYFDGLYLAMGNQAFLYSFNGLNWSVGDAITNEFPDVRENGYRSYSMISSTTGVLVTGTVSRMSETTPIIWKYNTKYDILPGFLNTSTIQQTASDFFQKFPVQSTDITDKTTNPNYTTSGCGIGWSTSRKTTFDVTFDLSGGRSLPVKFTYQNGVLRLSYDKYQVVETMYTVTSDKVNLVQRAMPHIGEVAIETQWYCSATVKGESEGIVTFTPIAVDGTLVTDKKMTISLPNQPNRFLFAVSPVILYGYRKFKAEWIRKGQTVPYTTSTVDLMDLLNDDSKVITNPLLPMNIHFQNSSLNSIAGATIEGTATVGGGIVTFYNRVDRDVYDIDTLESGHVPGGDPEYYFQKNFSPNIISPDREWTNAHYEAYPTGTGWLTTLNDFLVIPISKEDPTPIYTIGVGKIKDAGAVIVREMVPIDGRPPTKYQYKPHGVTNLTSIAYNGAGKTIAIGTGEDGLPAIVSADASLVFRVVELDEIPGLSGDTSAIFNRVFWSTVAGLFFIVGQKEGTTACIFSTPDGTTWKEEPLPTLSGTCMLMDISDVFAVGYSLNTSGTYSALIVSGTVASTGSVTSWTMRPTSDSNANIAFTCCCLSPETGKGLILGKNKVSKKVVAFKTDSTVAIVNKSIPMPLANDFAADVEFHRIGWDQSTLEFIAVASPNTICTLYGGTRDQNTFSYDIYDWYRAPEVTRSFLYQYQSTGYKYSLTNITNINGTWYACGTTTNPTPKTFPVLKREVKHRLVSNPTIGSGMYDARFGPIAYGNGMYLQVIMISADSNKHYVPGFLMSKDGFNWTRISSVIDTENMKIETDYLTFVGDRFVSHGMCKGTTVGYDPYAFESVDGSVWEKTAISDGGTSGSSRIDDIASNGDRSCVIGVADSYVAYKSIDYLETMTGFYLAPDHPEIGYRSICYFEKAKCFVAVGNNSGDHNDSSTMVLAYSYDNGATWSNAFTITNQNRFPSGSPLRTNFLRIRCNSDRMVILGQLTTGTTDPNAPYTTFLLSSDSPETWYYHSPGEVENNGLDATLPPISFECVDNCFFLTVQSNLSDRRCYTLRSNTGIAFRRVAHLSDPVIPLMKNAYICNNLDIRLIEKDLYSYVPTPKWLTKSFETVLYGELSGHPLSITGIAYGNGLFYMSVTYTSAGSSIPSSIVMRSFDCGATWSKLQTLPTPNSNGTGLCINALRYEFGRFVAVGYTDTSTSSTLNCHPFIMESVDGIDWTSDTISNISLGIASPECAILMDVACPPGFTGKWIVVGYTKDAISSPKRKLLVVTRPTINDAWVKANITYSTVGASSSTDNGLNGVAYNSNGCIAVGWSGANSLGIKIATNITATKLFDETFSNPTGGLLKIVTDPNSNLSFFAQFASAASRYVRISPTLTSPTVVDFPGPPIIQNVTYANSKFYVFCGPPFNLNQVFEMDSALQTTTERKDLADKHLFGVLMNTTTEVWYTGHTGGNPGDKSDIYTKGREITQ